jgi:hypothetical protein
MDNSELTKANSKRVRARMYSALLTKGHTIFGDFEIDDVSIDERRSRVCISLTTPAKLDVNMESFFTFKYGFGLIRPHILRTDMRGLGIEDIMVDLVHGNDVFFNAAVSRSSFAMRLRLLYRAVHGFEDEIGYEDLMNGAYAYLDELIVAKLKSEGCEVTESGKGLYITSHVI